MTLVQITKCIIAMQAQLTASIPAWSVGKGGRGCGEHAGSHTKALFLVFPHIG